jgi:hypothetical protein
MEMQKLFTGLWHQCCVLKLKLLKAEKVCLHLVVYHHSSLRRYIGLYHTFRDLPPNTLNLEVTQQEPSRSLRMALSCRNM